MSDSNRITVRWWISDTVKSSLEWGFIGGGELHLMSRVVSMCIFYFYLIYYCNVQYDDDMRIVPPFQFGEHSTHTLYPPI